jgi:hypothetical protein
MQKYRLGFFGGRFCGKGPAMVNTLTYTLTVFVVSSMTSILKIENRATKIGTMTPMDQILLKTHLLEAALMGNCMHPQELWMIP